MSKNIYSSGIDEILNSVEVDAIDDNENFQIDLEALLASEDFHEDHISFIRCDDAKTSFEISAPIISSSDLFHMGSETTMVSDHVDLESIARFTAQDNGVVLGSLYALYDAERREVRHLKAGILSTSNVLASRQTKAGSKAMLPRIRVLDLLSSQLVRNAKYRVHGPGVACSVCVHSKFIAVGTSRGMILLFDHSQELRQVLGASSINASTSVTSATSIAIHSSGSILCCGFDNGEISLWDIPKAACLKRIKDLHQNSICMVRFVYNSFSSSVDLSSSILDVLTLDSKGIVQKIRFSKMLWTSFVSTAECLLDGSGGPVHDMAVLPPLFPAALSTSDFSRPDLFQLIAISSNSRTYIIQVQPEVKVCFRWAPPLQQQFGRVEDGLPGIKPVDWTWIENFNEDTTVAQWQPLLARFSDGFLQILTVSNIIPGGRVTDKNSKKKSTAQAIKFSVLNERKLDNNYNIVCLRWLSSLSDEEVLSPMLSVISFSIVWIFRQNLELFQVIPISEQISRHLGIGGQSSETVFALRKSIYILSDESIYEINVPHWSEEVSRLIRDGRWLDALALVLENVNTEAGNSEFLEGCIKQYVAVSMDIITSDRSNPLHYKNHFHLVASVCVEYCCRSNRLQILFGYIYDRFAGSGFSSIFLDALEPYILARSITVVPESILMAYFDVTVRSQGTKDLSFERIVVFLDLSADINSNCTDAIIQYLLKNFLYSGALYVGAYKSPANFIQGFDYLSHALLSVNESEGRLNSICYKLLLFLRCAADGVVFPRALLAEEDRLLDHRSLSSLIRRILSDSGASLVPLYLIDSHALIFCVAKALGALILKTDDIAEHYNAFHTFLSSRSDSSEQLAVTHTFFEHCSDDLKRVNGALSQPLIDDCIYYFSGSVSNRTVAENSLIELLSTQLRSGNEYCMSTRLRLSLEKLHFWKVLLVLRNETDFSSALRSYVQLYSQLSECAAQDDLCRFIFDFISYQCSVAGTSKDTLSALCTHIVELAHISLALTETLVLEKLSNHSSEVISNTHSDPGVQFSLLHALVLFASKEDLVETFSESDIMLYIRLLAERRPLDVLPFIASHDHYSLQQCLQMCREKELFDAAAYLMERSGDVKTALVMLHAEITRGLQYVRKEAENMLKLDNVRSHNIEIIRNTTTVSDVDFTNITRESLAAQVLRKKPGGKVKLEAALNFPGFKDLQKAVKCAADICMRHGKTDTSIWFPTFDHLLKERQNIRLTTTSSSTEIVLVILSLLFHLFTTHMKLVVPPQDIVRRVAAAGLPGGKGSAGNNIFSEFKSVIINMLESYSGDVRTRSLLRNSAADDLSSLHRQKYRRLQAGLFSTSASVSSRSEHVDAPHFRNKKTAVSRVTKTNVSALRNLIRASSSSDEALTNQIINLTPPASLLPSSGGSGSIDAPTRKPGHLEKAAKFVAVIT